MPTRRKLLARSAAGVAWLAASATWPIPARAQAPGYRSAAFEAKSIAGALKALGVSPLQDSADVVLTAPEIAENGAVVPVAVATLLPGVRSLLILVEDNPAVLSAMFEVSDAVDASFATRVKMGQTSNVYAVAILGDGRALSAHKEVKVTVGGCGG